MVARLELMEATMGNIIAFKTRMTELDEVWFRRRWFCELLGCSTLWKFDTAWARERFKTRFGALPDETISVALNPSTAVFLWALEQEIILNEKRGDHKQADFDRALFAEIDAPDVRRKRDWISDDHWDSVCSKLQTGAQA
jgi:hypothetical protein